MAAKKSNGSKQAAGKKPQSTRRILGVVSARKPIRSAASPGKPAFPGFIYNGGSVITAPNVYTSFWGKLWSDAAHQAAAQRLNQFVQDLLNSKFMNVLSQYGAGAGAGRSTFGKASFVTNAASQLTDPGIHTILQGNINSGAIPEPPANNASLALLIFLDEDTEVKDANLGVVMCEPSGDTAFGYHNFFTTAAGNAFYYGVIPALDDACIRNSCGSSGCTLQLSQTQEQRRTQVTSHEFSEMLTDSNPPTGWYDQSDPNSAECGDICNGEADTIPGSAGSSVWTVQRIYSKFDDQQSNGANFCLSQAANPIPAIPGGPGSRT